MKDSLENLNISNCPSPIPFKQKCLATENAFTAGGSVVDV